MKTLETLKTFLDCYTWPFIEVIVVDDGSSDRTFEIADRFRDMMPTLRILQNPINRGKGYAVRRGMLQARGQWILYTDADLSTPIDELNTMLASALANGASVIIGSRALNRSLIEIHQPIFREWAGRLFNCIMRLITRLPFRDTQCGFKLYNAAAARQIFQRQHLDGFGFDVEDLFIARKLGLQVMELPVRWSDRPGTRVTFSKGLTSFLELIRIRYGDVAGRYSFKGRHTPAAREGQGEHSRFASLPDE